MKLIFSILAITLLFSCSSDKNTESVPVDKSHSDHLILTDTTVVMFYEDLEARLNFPLITCSTDDPSCDSLIYAHLNFTSITGGSIQDIVSEFESSGYGLSEIDYQVHLNENGIFDISYDMVSLGAHLSYSFYNRSLDLFDHTQINLVDMIDPSKMEDFLAVCNAKLTKNIESAKENLINSEEEDKEMILEMIVPKTMDKTSLSEFNIQKKGIAIYYDFFFPYYAKAYEPSPVIYFEKEEIKDYLNTKLDLVKRWLTIEDSPETAKL